MFYDSQFQHCSKFNETHLRILNLTMSMTGVFGALLSVFILGLLIGVKAYKTFLQRLFLYSVFATLMHEIFHVAQIALQFQYEGQDQVCALIGFISNWSGWIIYALNLDIILYLMFMVCQQLRGTTLFKLCRSRCKKTLECLCVLISVFLPVSVIWVPYKEHKYGLNEAYCYIKAYNKNCTEIGIADKLLYAYSFYEGVGLIAIISAVGIMVVYCTLTSLYQNAKFLLRKILVLLLATILYILVLNVMLAVDILIDISYPLSIFFASAATGTDLIFMFGYMFAFYSSQIKKSITFRRDKHLPQCYFDDDSTSQPKKYGSTEKTEKTTRPSYTYFNVPYTGEFTSVPN